MFEINMTLQKWKQFSVAKIVKWIFVSGSKWAFHIRAKRFHIRKRKTFQEKDLSRQLERVITIPNLPLLFVMICKIRTRFDADVNSLCTDVSVVSRLKWNKYTASKTILDMTNGTGYSVCNATFIENILSGNNTIHQSVWSIEAKAESQKAIMIRVHISRGAR